MMLAFSDTTIRRFCRFSLALIVLSLTARAQQPAPPSSPAVSGTTSEQRASINRRSESPVTPMTRDELLGRLREGKARRDQQRLETNFSGTLQAADRMRRIMLEATSPMTTQRSQRMQVEGAETLISDVNSIIRNRPAAIALGKALFWDSQVGSDGQTACASCHHKAGADSRKFSLGVGQRRLISNTGQAQPDGLEPSEAVQPDAILQMFESRWGGMMDFPAFLNDLALRALQRVQLSLDAPDFPRSDVQRVMGLISLKDDPSDILVVWNSLSEKLETMEPVVNPTTGEVQSQEILTLVELSVNVLLYNNLAEPTTAEAITAWLAAKNEPLQEMLSGYPSQQLGAYGLGMRLQAIRPSIPAPDSEEVPSPVGTAEHAHTQGVAAGIRRHRLALNSPTVINAGLSDRLFHDGRAASVFNGYDHLGDDAGQDGIGKYHWRNSRFERVLIRIPDAALASQSTAPLLSTTEMSWWGRQHHHVARKLLDREPLGGKDSQGEYLQDIAQDDSHLGHYVNPESGRITMTYRQLIQEAFHPEWWQSEQHIDVQERDAVSGEKLSLSQMEANFSLFWGLALWSYQNELTSGESEFDRILAERRSGKSVFAGQTQEQRDRREAILRGYALFQQHACADCHRGPEMATGTRATVYGPVLEFEGALDALNADTESNQFAEYFRLGSKALDTRIEQMLFGPDQAAMYYDNGFYNVGVSSDQRRDASFLRGIAGEVIPNFSSASKALESVANQFGQGLIRDMFEHSQPVRFSLARRHHDTQSQTVGSVRTPTLRNVELTAPYFHLGWNSGGSAFPTLNSVLEHYENPRNVEGKENEFLHPALKIAPGETVRETDIPDHLRGDILAFLRSLTDERVRDHLPPFDHPTLDIPMDELLDENGQKQLSSTAPTLR